MEKLKQDNTKKIILDLCSGTGAWSRPYKNAGYDVKIIENNSNLLEKNVEPINIIEFEYIKNVYGILAAPPCTIFAGSGARWWDTDTNNLRLKEGLSIVDACMRIILMHNPKWWALENPVGRLRRWIGPPKMYFQPYEYGDPYTKKTCLWGNFNLPVKTPVLPTEGGKIHKMPPSKDRAILRSITPTGFAQAFFEANQ